MKIESDIPIPARKRPLCELTRMVGLMKPGESVACSSEGEAQRVRDAMRPHGYRAAVRKLDSGGWRVWRVE